MTEFIRIYRSAKVNHLSPARSKHGEYEPLCGQRSAGPWAREFGDTPYVGTHICHRCEALAKEDTP